MQPVQTPTDRAPQRQEKDRLVSQSVRQRHRDMFAEQLGLRRQARLRLTDCRLFDDQRPHDGARLPPRSLVGARVDGRCRSE